MNDGDKVATMKVNTTCTFTSDGATVAILKQYHPVNRDFKFTISDGEDRLLGTLPPELTAGYGYGRAIAHVGAALIVVCPDLAVSIESLSGATVRWGTRDVIRAINEKP